MKKKITILKLLTGTLTLTTAIGIFPYNTLAASSTYTSAVTVKPDENDDFDGYAVDVIFTTEDGVLTNINLSSEWGRKATKNKTYSTNALIGIVDDMKASSSHIDTVSGATCSSNAIKEAILSASSASVWNTVSKSLTASVNGSLINDDASDNNNNPGEDSDNKPGEDSGNNPGEDSGNKPGEDSGNKPGKEDNSLTLPEGTSASYQNISIEDGIIKVQLMLPEGYTPSGINLIRIGNTAIMPARDPETFNNIFSFDTETGILSITKDNLDDEKTLTVSLKFTDGNTNGTTDIAVSILSESSISLSDKTASYTGTEIEIDPAEVTGSTGNIIYAYYSDESCTEQLEHPPIEPGTYYVTASVAEDENYYSAVSEPAKLIITPVENKNPDDSDNKTPADDTEDNTDIKTPDSSSSDTNTTNNTTSGDNTKATTAVTSSTTPSASTSKNTTSSTASDSTGSSQNVSSPKTGDTAPIFPLIGLLSASAASIGGYFKYKKKRI